MQRRVSYEPLFIALLVRPGEWLQINPRRVAGKTLEEKRNTLIDAAAYRELQKTLTESETLSKKDVLNLDGLKFKFVFVELIGLFRRALNLKRLGWKRGSRRTSCYSSATS